MALAAILIALIFSAHPQICFGQLKLGNNFNTESNKIAGLQQQSQKTNTETITVEHAVNTRNVKFLSGTDFNQPNVNKTMAFLNGKTISNLKLAKNQPDEPVSSPASSMVNGNGLAPQSSQGNFRSVFLNANHIAGHLNTTAQTPNKPSEVAGINAGSLSKSPLYISFGPPPLAASPSQTLILRNVQPMLSSLQFVPNTVKLQTSAPPAQKQVPHQTFASFHIPQTNAQNQANILYAQPPPAAAAPPTQPMMPTPDNTVQIRNSLTSLLLSHLLSQSSNVEDPSAPIMNHSLNPSSKPSNIKALLPLLLDLLNEENRDCCECGKYPRYNKCKPAKINKRLEDNSLEINSKSNTKERFVHAWQADKDDLLQQHTAEEEEDYSDDISDYSDEYYDDD